MSHCLGERLFECPTLRGAAIAMRERGRCSSIPFTNRRPRFNAEGLQATAHDDQTDDRSLRAPGLRLDLRTQLLQWPRLAPMAHSARAVLDEVILGEREFQFPADVVHAFFPTHLTSAPIKSLLDLEGGLAAVLPRLVMVRSRGRLRGLSRSSSRPAPRRTRTPFESYAGRLLLFQVKSNTRPRLK